ncbi:MAG TPA: sulfur carrier protein ThiS [Solimonas sp.]
MSLHVTVNNDPHELPDASTVASLLDHLDLGDRRIAVERNGEIVPRSRYDETALQDKDVLIVVQAIGGG